MPYVLCSVDEGLRPSEATVEVRDIDDRSEFLRVDRDFVKSFDNRHYLPIGIVYRDKESGKDLVLIELPHEADSGTNRLWVPISSIREAPSKPAVVMR
jgi:hypothetical protein